jgi:hypothetical protein
MLPVTIGLGLINFNVLTTRRPAAVSGRARDHAAFASTCCREVFSGDERVFPASAASRRAAI